METSKHKSVKKHRILIFTLTFFSYASLHAGRQSWSFVKSDMTQGENAFSKTFLGYMDFTFLISYAIGLATLGHYGDRMNLKYFTAFGMIITSIMLTLIGLIQVSQLVKGTWKNAIFIIIWIINGLSQSTGMPGFVAAMGNWFGSKQRGILMGIWIGMTNFGDILGYVIGGVMTNGLQVQWGYVPIASGVFIFFMASLILLFMFPYPEKIGITLQNEWGSYIDDELTEKEQIQKQQQLEKKFNSSLFSSLAGSKMESVILDENQKSNMKKLNEINFITAWSIPNVAIYAALFASMKSTVYGLLFWLPNYLQQKNTFTSFQETFVTSCFDVGIFLGGICVGILTDKLKKRAIIMGPFVVVSVITMLIPIFVDSYQLFVNILLFFSIGYFLGGPYNVCQSAIMVDLAKQKALKRSESALSTVAALIDGTGALFAAITQLVIPYAGVDNVFWVMLGLSIISMMFLSGLTWKDIQSLIRRRNRRLKSNHEKDGSNNINNNLKIRLNKMENQFE